MNERSFNIMFGCGIAVVSALLLISFIAAIITFPAVDNNIKSEQLIIMPTQPAKYQFGDRVYYKNNGINYLIISGPVTKANSDEWYYILIAPGKDLMMHPKNIDFSNSIVKETDLYQIPEPIIGEPIIKFRTKKEPEC